MPSAVARRRSFLIGASDQARCGWRSSFRRGALGWQRRQPLAKGCDARRRCVTCNRRRWRRVRCRCLATVRYEREQCCRLLRSIRIRPILLLPWLVAIAIRHPRQDGFAIQKTDRQRSVLARARPSRCAVDAVSFREIHGRLPSQRLDLKIEAVALFVLPGSAGR
jgi:hypothetical protein